MLKEFKEFIMRGNVLDMAIGIIIGASFSAIINSLVNDILMPPIGFILNGVDFSNFFLVLKEGAAPPPYETLAIAKEAGAVTLNYGLFINALISFLIVAFAVFLIVKAVNKLHKAEEEAETEPATKECPFASRRFLQTPPAARTAHPNCHPDTTPRELPSGAKRQSVYQTCCLI